MMDRPPVPDSLSVPPATTPARDTRGPTPLAQCGPLADLATRAREAGQRSRQIVPLLPAPLREHVGFAAVHNDAILLLVESAAWATRARMEQARILAAAHSLGLAARTVTARVALPPPPASEPATAGPTVTDGAAQSIRAAASSMADTDLRELFLKIAALAETPSSAHERG